MSTLGRDVRVIWGFVRSESGFGVLLRSIDSAARNWTDEAILNVVLNESFFFSCKLAASGSMDVCAACVEAAENGVETHVASPNCSYHVHIRMARVRCPGLQTTAAPHWLVRKWYVSHSRCSTMLLVSTESSDRSSRSIKRRHTYSRASCCANAENHMVV